MRSFGKIAILFPLCIIISFSFNLYNKVQLPKAAGTACLDGSPYAFYIYEAQDDVKVNKLLIYFQETAFGWCIKDTLSSTLEQCHKFIIEDSLIDYGSSTQYGNSEMFLNGILSPFEGATVSQWTKVLIKSCDGGSYLGNKDPVEYKGKNLYFKGGKNVIETFKYLNNHKYFQNMSQIIISGSFNGAIAAIQWSSYLKTLTKVPIRIIADAAVFPNLANKQNIPLIQNRMKNIQKFIIVGDSVPNLACAQKNKDQQWKCLFIEQLYQFIDQSIPVFYTQSLYDGWGIKQILGYSCTQQFASLSQCTKKQREAIDLYHHNVTDLLYNKLLKHGNKNGAFGIACVAHQFLAGRWNNDFFEVPMDSGNLVVTVVSQWIKKNQQTIKIDTVEWPQNKQCSRKLLNLDFE